MLKVGEVIHIIFLVCETRFVTGVIRIEVFVCSYCLSRIFHTNWYISLWCSTLQHKILRRQREKSTLFYLFSVRLLFLEESWKRLLVCAVSVLCAKWTWKTTWDHADPHTGQLCGCHEFWITVWWSTLQWEEADSLRSLYAY